MTNNEHWVNSGVGGNVDGFGILREELDAVGDGRVPTLLTIYRFADEETVHVLNFGGGSP